MPSTASTPLLEDDARGLALAVLVDMLARGRSLTEGLRERLTMLGDGRDRALASELCYGVARWLPRLDACLDLLMDKPLREKETQVRAILLLGLYQLMFTRVAEHAAVAESVALTRRSHKRWATGLVNAVLRNFLRRRARLEAALDRDERGRYAHPSWLVDATRDAWPQDWPSILDANNQRPPLAIRVNARRGSRTRYQDRLEREGIAAAPIAHTDHGLVLAEARDVHTIPGFGEGLVSVQDGAAQLAAHILDPQAEQRVLDACAAPGGKSAHMLEREPAIGELVAVDRDDLRLERVRENFERLGLRATVVCADAGDTRAWWDGMPFDRILADVPCSATGVIRRHPDIKLQRRPADVERLQAAQIRLLDALWPLLAPRGRLVYATCSYLPRENDHVLAEFLAKHPDATGGPIPYKWGRATEHGRQVLPGEDAMDGFYYALLGKH